MNEYIPWVSTFAARPQKSAQARPSLFPYLIPALKKLSIYEGWVWL